jgi:hypothetical protein
MTAPADRERSALETVAADYAGDPAVELKTMLRSPGLRVGDKIFAFLDHDARLVVKLPRERAQALVADGTAELVVMGTRTMREWVGIPLGEDADAGTQTWRSFAREAHDYVASLEK